MAHPLDGVQAKMDRALEHLDALDREVDIFLNSEPEPYDVVLSNNWGTQVGRFHIIREPPLRLGIIAGDFAQNLRAALDHLVYQVAKLTTQSPQGTGFPIAVTEADYWEPRDGQPSMRDRYLGDVDPEYRTIFDEIQPYRGRTREEAEQTPAARLNRFANADKHRLIHAAYGQLHAVRVETVGGSAPVAIIPPDPLPLLEEGTEVYKIKVGKPSNPQVKVSPILQFSMVYGRERLHDGDFRYIHHEVVVLVEAFRALFD